MGMFVHLQQKKEELWLLAVFYSLLSATYTHTQTLPFNLLITRNHGSRKEETEKDLKCADLSWVGHSVTLFCHEVYVDRMNWQE